MMSASCGHHGGDEVTAVVTQESPPAGRIVNTPSIFVDAMTKMF
jgi:hypothetical protein